jgi:hypothetical protein
MDSVGEKAYRRVAGLHTRDRGLAEKDAFAACTDLLIFLTLFGNIEQFWEYLVSTHADEGARAVKGNPISIYGHRLNPGMREHRCSQPAGHLLRRTYRIRFSMNKTFLERLFGNRMTLLYAGDLSYTFCYEQTAMAVRGAGIM